MCSYKTTILSFYILIFDHKLTSSPNANKLQLLVQVFLHTLGIYLSTFQNLSKNIFQTYCNFYYNLYILSISNHLYKPINLLVFSFLPLGQHRCQIICLFLYRRLSNFSAIRQLSPLPVKVLQI
jgi:hypothetical protein